MILLAASLAGAAPFRADHHDPDLRWHTQRTRFLRVHHPVSRRPGGAHPIDASGTAAEVVRLGDELVLRMSEALGWAPTRPIHVVITDDAEDATAFALPQWGWIVLSADGGAEAARLRGRTEWVADALAHELGHLAGHGLAAALPAGATYGIELGIVAEGAAGGVAATLGLPPNEPYGWSEGGAEYWSDRIGVNHWSPERAATLRVAALEGRLLDWDEWLVATGKDGQADAERAYQMGYAFAAWLERRHGQDVFAALARASGERWSPSWARRLEAITGEPARVTWARFQAFLTAEAMAEAARLRALGEVSGREVETWWPGGPLADLDARDRWRARHPRDREETLEASGSWDLHPRISPDGRWYAEGKVGAVRVLRAPETLWPGISGVEPDPEALSVRLDRAGASAWLPARFGSAFSFVPGRDALVLAAPEDLGRPWWWVRRADAWNRLFVVDLTPDRRRVRHRGGRIEVEEGPGDGRAELRRRATPIPGTLRARDPAVSPDGARVAFVRVADGRHTLEVVGLDGAAPRVLDGFAGRASLQGPSWSPDGRALVVSALHQGQPDLWRVDPESGDWTRLTDDPQEELDPWWGPDGIWFVSDPDGIADVHRLGPDGVVARMTRVLGGAATPSLTPSGHLLFASRTAHGTKAVAVARHDLLFEPVGGFGTTPDPEAAAAERAWVPPARPPASEPYRPAEALLPVAGAPIVRLDLSGPAPKPLGGGYLRLRDAVERVDLGLLGLVGEDLLGEARLTWRGLPPELSLWSTGSSDRSAVAGAGLDRRRSLGWVGLDADQRLSALTTLTLSVRGGSLVERAGDRAPTTRLSSLRAGAALSVGEAPTDDRTGAHGRLGWTRGWSSTPAGPVRFHRVEGSAAGVVGTDVGGDRVADREHRFEWSVTGGATDRALSNDERLRAGGDLPYALRFAAVEPSTPLPGLPPFALIGDWLAVGSGTWVVPLAPRVRTGAHGLQIQRIEAGLRLDLAGAATLDPTPDPWVLGGAAELRLAAVLFDARWDSVARVALARPSAPLGGGEPVPAWPLWPGPRFTLGLGTGF